MFASIFFEGNPHPVASLSQYVFTAGGLGEVGGGSWTGQAKLPVEGGKEGVFGSGAAALGPPYAILFGGSSLPSR